MARLTKAQLPVYRRWTCESHMIIRIIGLTKTTITFDRMYAHFGMQFPRYVRPRTMQRRDFTEQFKDWLPTIKAYVPEYFNDSLSDLFGSPED